MVCGLIIEREFYHEVLAGARHGGLFLHMFLRIAADCHLTYDGSAAWPEQLSVEQLSNCFPSILIFWRKS
ncbi:MAG: hypothetical protein OEV23_04305 [Gallionella sp.]|nr:hypothetical protein [Gallionella sp.]